MKILAVDYGDARTGLAACDPGEMLASPVGTVEHWDPQKVAEEAAKAAKAAKAASSTTEAGRVGDRPYARGRAYKPDRYDDET